MPDRPEKKLKTARELALEILLEGEKGKTPLTELIDQNLGQLRRVQRGFLTELCYGSTRMRLTLDWIIRKHSSRPLGAIDRVTREILRLGLYQVFFLTKVPLYAAVDESVKLAKKYGARQADRFVNAVMRNAAGAKGGLPYPDERKDPARHISLRYSHPLWLVKRWIGFFGVERAKSICQAGIAPPPMTIRANQLRIKPRALVGELEKEGVKSEEISGAAIRIISSRGSLSRLDSFAKGYFYIQDITSMEPALLLDPRPGESVLDLCSAPGGKTTHMAELMEDRGRIISCDISHEKVLKLRANLDRLGMTIAEPVVADVMGIDELFPGMRFDRVLI
ncbi:MAG: 16S rRNA (cytosine(967)-C(5))-methyltransferase RsmB, partial [Thermoplasmata archaeon]|nr:16S rRNA (cytosine(967)-C(5))-methyltransferase RsmB [Thermoplasmata archaeon]